MLLRDLNLYTLIKEYNKNKNKIDRYLAVKRGVLIENFNSETSKILNLSIGLFLTIFLIYLALWIWGLVILIKYAKIMPIWAVALSIISVIIPFFGGPLFIIIIVYATKGTKK